MGVLGNNNKLNFGAFRAWGGAAVAQPYTPGTRSRSNWAAWIAQSGATTVLTGAAKPTGYYPPATYFPPVTAGEMSVRPEGTGTLTADLYPSKSMSVDMTGLGDLDATGALAVAMAVAMTGDGTLTATIAGRLAMAMALTGSGDFDGTMAGIGSMAVDMLGTGDLEATIAAYGNMSVDITVTGTGLSTANVGQAVWSYLIENGYSAEELMRLISAVQLGKTDITGSTFTFRDVNDTTDRVVATVVASERTAVTLDPD